MASDSYRFWMNGILATDLQEISSDPSVLDDGRFWAVVQTFEGKLLCARFGRIEESSFPDAVWTDLNGKWQSTFNESEYCSYVQAVRELIADGSVYQVNACRILSAQCETREGELSGLFSKILQSNPAPYASYLCLPEVEIASASPELFLKRDGSEILTSPIKGTLPIGAGAFGEKDKSENLMIVDLMRNDFGSIAVPGSVDVSDLFRDEEHPGLRQLVSDVRATLRPAITWDEILKALAPPGSVSGAPKSSAVKIIEKHEGRRDIYCGALGYVQGDQSELAVAIRTFWKRDSQLLFGTGAGITWGSEPLSEWNETVLKADRLISIAGGVQ